MKATVLGGGFAGCTVAGLLAADGWDVQLWEKEPHLGGGCRTFFHAGHPFTYGPRLYYGYSKPVFEWVDSFVPLRRFPFELLTLAHEPNDAERKFWTYPPHEADLPHYPRAEQIAQELIRRDNTREPQDFDEYYLQKIGPTLYDMFTEHYSKRMWKVATNKVFDIFKWSAKDKPIESGTREAYKGAYLAYPIEPTGYNRYFERMTKDVEVFTSSEWKHDDDNADVLCDALISTIPIDEFSRHAFGELPYIGRDFQLLVLPTKEVFPGDVRFCHYAGKDDHFTRVTEFKKITFHESDSTLLVLETPSHSNKLYPYVTKANTELAKRYLDALPANVHSIGRLGTYKYSTIEQTISQAFACYAKITGKPNIMEGQFFEIGDKSLIGKDRKAA